MSEKKIAFFDIDGTLTSEVDGSIPSSVGPAIARARACGHKMFLNSGRCDSFVEQRFRALGFDGMVCGCGTNIFYDGEELMHVTLSPDIKEEILQQAALADVDLLLEGKAQVAYDLTRPLHHPDAILQYEHFQQLEHHIQGEARDPHFIADKFCVWFQTEDQLDKFREVSDRYFTCIDRTRNFREFVPYGYSKGTGIHYLLDRFGMSLDQAYAFGDSNNDLPMLQVVPHSVVMGNAMPESLKDTAYYVAGKASEDGLAEALEHLGFFEA